MGSPNLEKSLHGNKKIISRIMRTSPYDQSLLCLLDRGGEKEALSETRQAFEVAAAPRTLLSYKISIILKLQGHTKRG